MDYASLKKQWFTEEAHSFEGWDFSHLDGRIHWGELPWNYADHIREHLEDTHRILDMGTGGGEFLLSLQHPYTLTSVTEGYPPNIRLCEERLAPLGITVKAIGEDNIIPYSPESFDVVLNRHEDFDPHEVYRVLSPGGWFITQQVGGENNSTLSQKLIPGFQPAFPNHNLERNRQLLEDVGFTVCLADEAYPQTRIYDVGAMVYFAKILPWEFPGFTVESAFPQLCRLQEEIEEQGYIESREHRFILAAQKY